MINKKIQLSTCTKEELLEKIKIIQAHELSLMEKMSNILILKKQNLEITKIILEIFQERQLKITTARNDA